MNEQLIWLLALGTVSAVAVIAIAVIALGGWFLIRLTRNLADRLMATDWPSYAGYIMHNAQMMTPHGYRMPMPSAKDKAREIEENLDRYRNLVGSGEPEAEEAQTVAEL